jgi:hypothetical protein
MKSKERKKILAVTIKLENQIFAVRKVSQLSYLYELFPIRDNTKNYSMKIEICDEISSFASMSGIRCATLIIFKMFRNK